MKQFFLIFCSTLLTLFVQAQHSDSFDFTFNHLAICVKDLDRSVQFYKNVLNLKEITNKTQKAGITWLSLGENKELHLISYVKDSFLTNKAIHFALTIPNFDAFIKRLDALKITYTDLAGTTHAISTRADEVRQIYFKDPDNYWIEVNSVGQK